MWSPYIPISTSALCHIEAKSFVNYYFPISTHKKEKKKKTRKIYTVNEILHFEGSFQFLYSQTFMKVLLGNLLIIGLALWHENMRMARKFHMLNVISAVDDLSFYQWDPSTENTDGRNAWNARWTVSAKTSFGHIPWEYLGQPMNFSADPHCLPHSSSTSLPKFREDIGNNQSYSATQAHNVLSEVLVVPSPGLVNPQSLDCPIYDNISHINGWVEEKKRFHTPSQQKKVNLQVSPKMTRSVGLIS